MNAYVEKVIAGVKERHGNEPEFVQTVEEVLERVNGKKSGLTSEQVKRSREKCGWNELTEGKKKGILQIFF